MRIGADLSQSASDNDYACITLGFRSDLIIAERTHSKPDSDIDYACISLQFTPMTNDEFVDPYRSEVGKIYIHKMDPFMGGISP